MCDMSMVRRVVARYAARNFSFKPVVLDKCRHCGGEGVQEDSAFEVKFLCVSCWGTGTEATSVEALQAQVDEITVTYQSKRDEFEGIKKKYRGRGSRQLGMMGRDLQTLNGALTDRKKILDRELTRITKGKFYAQVVKARAAASS